MSEIECENKGIWDWSKVCLVPRLLIGQLLHIKMNYCTCKNIIAHVKVNYCAYKNFTAHLKVNYCACEIDFCIFFFLVPPGHYFLNTCNLSFWTCWSYTKDSFPLCFKANSRLLFEEEHPKRVSTSKGLGRALCSWKSSLPPCLHGLFSEQEHEEETGIKCGCSSAGSCSPPLTVPGMQELGGIRHTTPPDKHLCAKFPWLHMISWQVHVLIMITELPASLLQ